MRWKKQTDEEWFRIGFLALFLVGIVGAVVIMFLYYAKNDR